ncbi:MAG: ABC transporter ATP-binding protein [Proteobacteria bacterium]|nr:ABC transporter ATP-binding protein [Pseudomonadota bacterium]
MIRLRNVSCGYGRRQVLQGIDLDFANGEMVGVLGPNGSGKTTLLLAMSGVLPLKTGQIEIGGASLSNMSPKAQARRMASVPQRIERAFDLRVLSVVLMGRYPYISFLGGYQDRDRRIALEAMKDTGTVDFRDRLTGQLSGGEFQRVIIARALAQQTDVLLLDEATSGLDIARKVEIYDLLLEKNRGGETVVSAIHDLNLAALYCRRLVFLKQGRIVLDGPAEDVFTEENLAEVYGARIKVAPHPETGAPQAFLVPGASICG